MHSMTKARESRRSAAEIAGLTYDSAFHLGPTFQPDAQGREIDVNWRHEIDYPDGARFVRVTGTDLERVPRLKFDLAKGEAQVIESVSAGAA